MLLDAVTRLGLGSRPRRLQCCATVRLLADATAEHYGITLGELLGERRFPKLCEARRVLYFAARLAGYSYPEIGFQLGRDHTSVMYGCRKVEACLPLRLAAETIESRCRRAA